MSLAEGVGLCRNLQVSVEQLEQISYINKERKIQEEWIGEAGNTDLP